MFEYDKDYISEEDDKFRCQILEVEPPIKGNTVYFYGLRPEGFEELVNRGLLDPEDAQNNAPPAGEFNAYCKLSSSNFTMHGYVVSRHRSDCRISIEGVEGWAETDGDLERFINSFRLADEFNIDWERRYCYCWYD